MKEFVQLARRNWLDAWNHKAFRMNFLFGILLLAIAMIATSFFFNYIQDAKDGVVLNDWILQKLPAIDVSIVIVTLMMSAALLFAARGIHNPNILITFLFAMILQLIIRMITISITGFFPPPGLVVLRDPMGSMLYQYRFITRDLFYSGHTALICLFYFCSFKKRDKLYLLFAAISVAFLLLVQHVHYTVDVLCAPLFAFVCFWLAKKIIRFQNAHLLHLENHVE
jgi:hypothetical protein